MPYAGLREERAPGELLVGVSAPGDSSGGVSRARREACMPPTHTARPHARHDSALEEVGGWPAVECRAGKSLRSAPAFVPGVRLREERAQRVRKRLKARR